MRKINNYKTILTTMVNIASNAEINVFKFANIELIKRNWLLGKQIYEAIITNRKQDYGKKLIIKLSKDLSQFGKGFNKTNLYRYLSFYKCYPNIFPTLRRKSFLQWSHYRILINIKNKNIRNWYEDEALTNSWSYRNLERAVRTNVYYRTMSHQINKTSNFPSKINKYNYLKSLFILDFLNFNKNIKYKETELENRLIENISKFLFELGYGYSYVGNQFRLKTDDSEYYVDLVFYNSILKRHLLIDLKVGMIKHGDIGQMAMYLQLFDEQHKQQSDNDSIGMILSSDLNSDIVKYLMAKTPNHIVASKYLTYLPTKEQLRKEIEKVKLALSKK